MLTKRKLKATDGHTILTALFFHRLKAIQCKKIEVKAVITRSIVHVSPLTKQVVITDLIT